MDYLIGGIFLFGAVMIVLTTISRRLTGRGVRPSTDRGVTVSQPAADEPTPGMGGNAIQPGAERRIPPA